MDDDFDSRYERDLEREGTHRQLRPQAHQYAEPDLSRPPPSSYRDPQGWQRWQTAFVKQRETQRAEKCACGHKRHDHVENVAHCRACLCGSFKAVR